MRIADVSLRDVTIAPETGLHSSSDVTHRKCARRILGDFEKVSELRTGYRTRRLTLACSQRLLWWVRHVLVGGRWKSQNGKIVSLSLCRRTSKLKGNKKVRTWTEKSLHVFRILRSYVLCICVMNVPCKFRIFVYMAMVQDNQINNLGYLVELELTWNNFVVTCPIKYAGVSKKHCSDLSGGSNGN